MHEWECTESSASTVMVHMANGARGLELTSTGQAISDSSLSCIGLAIHPTQLVMHLIPVVLPMVLLNV